MGDDDLIRRGGAITVTANRASHAASTETHRACKGILAAIAALPAVATSHVNETPKIEHDARDVLTAQAEAVEAQFAEWFRKNYPGPDTIIHNPDWHAPRIFRAARAALRKEGGA